MKKNQFLAFLLALIMLMTAALPAMAEGEEPKEYHSGDYTYILLEDGTAEIVGYNYYGASAEVKIPDQLDGYAVSSVASENPFQHSLQAISFDVTPDNPYFAVIDGVLFSKADKRLIAYPQNKRLASYSIPQGIRIIGDYAFYSCESLQNITIPDSITSIGANPFSSCDNLSEIIVSPNHPCLEMIDGLLIYKSDEEIRLVTYPYILTAVEYTIPEGITSIGDGAFYWCNSLQSITIPDSITSIGDDAFSSCYSLQSITIPDSIASIGDDAFSYCCSLQSITIPNSVTSIGDSVFNNCDSLQSVTIPGSVPSIGDYAFWSCDSLQSVTILDSVTSIGENAFYGCDSLQSITIPDSVTSIDENAFNDCPNLTLTVTQGSYAETYAIENDIKYVYPDANDWLLD